MKRNSKKVLTRFFKKCNITSKQTNKHAFSYYVARKDTTTNKKNMTVKDAIHFVNYYEVAFESSEELESDEYNNACNLVDDYNFLVALITECCNGAVGKVDFKTIENYNAEEVNQMIDNYVEEVLIA